MGSSFLLASITDKLNHHQGHLNNMLETFQNLITSGAESGDILAFDGTNWRASSGTQGAASAAQSTADGAASAAGAAQSTADGAVTAANTAQARADAAHVTLSSHATDIAANTAKVSCPVWVPATDPGYPVYTVATGATDFANMVTIAPNNRVASNNTQPIKLFTGGTSGNSYMEVSNVDTNNVLIGDPNNAEGTDNVEITFTLSIPISGVTKIVVGTGSAYLASINGGAFSSLSGTSSHMAVNTLYDDSTTPISLRSIAIKRIRTGFGSAVRWNYIKVNDVLLVDGVTPSGLTYSEPYIANAVPSATAAAIAANTAAIAAKVTSPVWVPTLDPGYASYTVVNGATDFENMVTYSSNVTFPNSNALVPKMFNTSFIASYAEFRNAVADGNDDIVLTFTLSTPISAVTKIAVGTGNIDSASINGGAFSNVADSGFPRHNTLYDLTTPINLTSITLKRTLNNQTGGCMWSYIRVNDVYLVSNQTPAGLNYFVDTYVANALPSATEAAIAANTAKVSCPTWVPATDPSYVTPAELAAAVPALGTAGQVLTVNSGETAAEWATAAGGSMTPVYAKQYLPVNTESFPAFSTYYVFGNFTASSRLAIAFESPSGLGLVHSPNGDTGGVPKNGYFKIPTGHAGLYNIHVSLSFQLNHRTARIQIYRTPTGGSAGVILEADNTLTDDHDNHFLYNVHGTEQLADGDILHVECYTYSSSSTTVRLHGRATKNFFEIFKIA